ncbi:hypothetical protein M422DRAFT_42776 [Sphaerobolus stellatus SS14]|nr:hypothetical protein M422DRAFT_42776 [Sphaerobolus stellatus SS14]
MVKRGMGDLKNLWAMQKDLRSIVESIKIAVEKYKARIIETPVLRWPCGSRRRSPADLSHQESLIQEREPEIREIGSGINELSEILRDLQLGTLVNEQRYMMDDDIEPGPWVGIIPQSAAEGLTITHEYQHKAAWRVACLTIILLIVLCIVYSRCFLDHGR